MCVCIWLKGMTDLAAPLLYVYDGDESKAFWIFVKVMELFVSELTEFTFIA